MSFSSPGQKIVSFLESQEKVGYKCLNKYIGNRSYSCLLLKKCPISQTTMAGQYSSPPFYTEKQESKPQEVILLYYTYPAIGSFLRSFWNHGMIRRFTIDWCQPLAACFVWHVQGRARIERDKVRWGCCSSTCTSYLWYHCVYNLMHILIFEFYLHYL